MVSDLIDATGGGFAREPLPASSITLLPGTEFETLQADSLTQVIIQVAPPPVSGIYTGTLFVRWMRPLPGQLAIPLRVVARTRPALALQEPDQLVVRGRRGEVLDYTVTLRERTPHGSPVTNLHAVPQDLRSPDGQVIEADRLRASFLHDSVAGGKLVTASIDIDLRGVHPGAYSGNLLFESAETSPVTMPITLEVRHRFWLPLAVLCSGVLIGLPLASYQSRGKKRDILIVRIVQIRRELEEDGGPQAGFQTQIECWLSKAESAVRTTDWQTAQSAIEAATDLMRTWQSGNWLPQIAYLRKLQAVEDDEVLHRNPSAVAIKVFLNQVDATLENVHTFKSPSVLREEIIRIETGLQRFKRLCQQCDTLATIRMDSPDVLGDKKEAWRLRLQRLEQDLSLLPPGEESKWETLELSFDVLADEMIAAIHKVQEVNAGHEEIVANKGVRSRGFAESFEGISDHLKSFFPATAEIGAYLPDAGSFNQAQAQRATSTLRVSGYLIHGLGGAILAAIGYATLYWTNPTFGANPADYLALLAWGLGAQTTFSDVAGLLQGWGIPFGLRAQ